MATLFSVMVHPIIKLFLHHFSGGSRISLMLGRQPSGVEIERIWTGGGARPKFYFVDPSLHMNDFLHWINSLLFQSKSKCSLDPQLIFLENSGSALFDMSLSLAETSVTLKSCHIVFQAPPSQSWWQKSTFYQVYVRSFQDSNADGSGDLKGKGQGQGSRSHWAKAMSIVRYASTLLITNRPSRSEFRLKLGSKDILKLNCFRFCLRVQFHGSLMQS